MICLDMISTFPFFCSCTLVLLPKSDMLVPSGYSGTSQAERGSHSQHSSGDSSVESRLDYRDQWRIGGPGELPSWPLTTGPPESPQLVDVMINTAINKLAKGGFSWRKVFVCGRATKGAILRGVDSTLLIYVGFERLSELLSLLDDLVGVFHGLGFQGS
jgi:hypothetical protein